MKKIIFPYIILSFLLSYTAKENKYVTDYINQESSFYYKEDFFKLVTKGTLVHNDYYYDNSLLIKYDVYKNDVKMESKEIERTIKADCDYFKGSNQRY